MILLDCWLQTPIGVPCLLYIDGRHNRQLQVLLDRGAYVALENDDHRRLAAAQSPSSWWRIIWYGWFIFHPTNDCAISWVFGGFFKRGVSLAPQKKRHPRNMITRRALTPGTIKTGRVLRSQSHKEAILYHGRVKHIFTPFLYLNHATTIHSNRHVKWLYKLANIWPIY